jgi:hypothetical protein
VRNKHPQVKKFPGEKIPRMCMAQPPVGDNIRPGNSTASWMDYIAGQATTSTPVDLHYYNKV